MEHHIQIKSRADDPAIAAEQCATARQVIARFGSDLPTLRLLCYFDNRDCEELKTTIGKANRGFALSVVPKKDGRIADWYLVPYHARECIFVYDGHSPTRRVADYFIYLHGSTVENQTGFVMTIAHELQHFVQYAKTRSEWAASNFLMNFDPAILKACGVNMWNIPTEHDARIIGKRVALMLCGVDRVKDRIQACINEHLTDDDVEDWKFVRDLEEAAEFDLRIATKRIFQTLKPYRTQIEARLQRLMDDDDFNKIDLALLLK